MSNTMQLVMAALSSPVLGLLTNYILAKVLPDHSRVRRFTTTFLSTTPGQAQAVYAAVHAEKANKAAAVIQAIDAVATGVKLAADEATKGDQ